MNIDLEAIRLTPGQSLDDALILNQVSPLATYLEHPDWFELGAVVLAPAYRLEEVEETASPEKPGVPVEPYVGLSWACSFGYRRSVISVQGSCYEVVLETEKGAVFLVSTVRIGDYRWENYPHTPSTPAVTRRVKKWVKIEHTEVPSDGVA